MRLKEDTSNWKASNVQRKIAEIPEAPKHRAKKDKRKWCKGKVGVEHDYQVKEVHHIFHLTWTKEICTKCGKQTYD